MPRFMLDTDICSYIMRRRPGLLRYLETLGPGDACISVITKCEILAGLEISPNPARDRGSADDFLANLAALDFPDEAARHYAEILGDLRRRGRMIGANDLFLAAHARCLGLTLVTNNTREFSRVEGLKIENWAA
jgi:tRNA(fMet)-specific endonuclease VapC